MSSQELTQTARNEQLKENEKKPAAPKRKLMFRGIAIVNDGGFDIIYMILVFALLTIGLVMMFSASYVSAKYDAETGYDAYYYIKRQLGFAVLGVAAMFIVSRINSEWYKKLTIAFAIICLFLLILVLIFPHIIPGKETFKRWLYIPGIHFTFQPSDLAKLGIIMFFAWMLDKYKKPLETKWWVAIVFFAILAFTCLLIYKEKHLSCTILMLFIGICMMYLGGVDSRWFIFGFIAIAILGTFVVVFRDKILDPYQAERIDSFIHKDYNDVNTRWQTNQSLFALGSGGFFGLGLGNSKQKHLYMPEPQNDFIFAIVGEELGFFRCLIIIILFALLVWRGFVIATKAKTMYDRLLVLGISLQVGIQTILNILVVTDMMPNTGISLPFFSYGGTALDMQLLEMGMVLSVSRSASKKA